MNDELKNENSVVNDNKKENNSNDIVVSSGMTNEIANGYCFGSLGAKFGGGLLTYISSFILPTPASFLSVFFVVGYLISWALLIVVRIKCPKNKFGLILMIYYIIELILYIIGIIMMIMLCKSIADSGCE